MASEFGNHYLYQIAHLGDDDDEPEFSSAMPLEEGDTFFFAPRQLRNLVLVDELDSLSPIMASHIADLGNLICYFLIYCEIAGIKLRLTEIWPGSQKCFGWVQYIVIG